MKLIQVSIFLVSFVQFDCRFTFYHTNPQSVFDCLYAYILDSYEIDDGAYMMLYHLIPYCQRLNENEKLTTVSYENIEKQISFKELYEKGITSSQLLDWFAPIDVAEDYEINGKNSDHFFNNCSSTWFGSKCQYQIIRMNRPSFGQLIRKFFVDRDEPSFDVDYHIGSCYTFLPTCIRGPLPMCLDWREVCNGIADCINGEDEEYCYLLERNQCSENEFRCEKSGECIPQIFFEDQGANCNCLDGSDKMWFGFHTGDQCIRFPTFECEEVSLRLDVSFTCGDGQIVPGLIPRFRSFCQNLRDKQMTITMFTSMDHISNLACRQFLRCLLQDENIDFLSYSQNETYCQMPLEHCPLKWLVFPEYPILYSFFQFVYLTNRSTKDLTPDFICFHPSRCPKYLFCSVDIGMRNGLHCCHGINITYTTVTNWFSLENIFRNSVENCLKSIQGETTVPSNLQKRSHVKNSIEPHNKFLFGDFCDGHSDLSYEHYAELDSDESDCYLWPCNNPYTRCNQFSNCLNGLDELDCSYSQCSSNELICNYYGAEQPEEECLSVSHFAEEYVNLDQPGTVLRLIHLVNETNDDVQNYLFWNETKCLTIEYNNQTHALVGNNDDVCCMPNFRRNRQFLGNFFMRNNERFCQFHFSPTWDFIPRLFLQSSRLGYFPSVDRKVSYQSTLIQFNQQFNVLDVQKDDDNNWYCNRGFPILYENNQTIRCLCPPSYFGDQCQWQNQRISLTIQLKYFSFLYEMPIFQVILMLIDDQGEILPYHEQIIYVPKRDCGIKYNIYLLYPERPKNTSIDYSIRVDIFNRITLTYWSSWYFPILFPFLPVNRISTHLSIPLNPQGIESSCPLSCKNQGKCMKYMNKNSSYFCQCNQGYSGLECQIKHNCSCSSDSFCLGSSICICPLDKFGRQCYLKHTVCQSPTNPCQNNGQCIPVDDRIALKKFTCTCKEGFLGDRCEQIQNRIDLVLSEKRLTPMSMILLYFITIYDTKRHLQSVLLKQVPYGDDRVIVHTTIPFHLVFLEISPEEYYLVVRREKFIQSEYIQTKILTNDRCVFIQSLLNETLKTYHVLRRIKYHPFLCREKKHLNCFYDELYTCICDQDRFSNCFSFNRNTTFNCNQTENLCENEGKCFLSNQTCSSTIKCICSGCFYGTKCQLTTKGFVLSLDYILSYHIKANISFARQPMIIRISLVLIIIIFILGFINGLFSIVTFRNKRIQTVGCGIYLLASGWISIILIFILLIKFLHLILSQMNIYDHRFILNINCILLDMFIKVLLASNDWLDGCVSIERVITVKQGVKFNKNQSKKIAKSMILLLFLVTVLSHIHDPLHRQIIDDTDIDEKRIWCIVQYSSSINRYNSFITLFHFLVPFTINLISTIIIIIALARHRSTTQRKLSHIEHLKIQFKKHYRHFIASFILVILGLPRLIISFISGCMKSPSSSWLFLSAYLLSFLPSMMTFIVYVLPSEAYRKQFNTLVKEKFRRFRN